MTQKKSYSRYFIILQEDEKGYSLASDKLPSGYTKLEMKNDKCKISFYVQNLKKEHAPYYLMLICNKKDIKKMVKLAEMNIDDHGRAEVSYEYAADNIANTSIAADKITGAAIVKFMGQQIVSVMSGFATTEVPEWKGFVLVEEDKNRDEKKEESIFDKYEQKIEEVKSDVTEEVRTEDSTENSEVKETIGEDNIVEKEVELEESTNEDEKRTDEIVEEIKNDESVIIEEVEIKEEKLDSTSNVECEEDEDARHKKCKCKDYPKGKHAEFFMNIVNECEEVEDVCHEINRCRWFKVHANSLCEMSDISDYNKYTVMYYPMINYYPYIGLHGHYLMGLKCDPSGRMKYIVYAIPGRKAHVDQPFAGRTGFVTWVPLKPGEENEDSFGYWLMFYDFRNSTIVIPIK